MDDRIEPGLCLCGCGRKTSLAPATSKARGWVKGQPVRYIKGHAPASTYHNLSEIDPKKRMAVCSKCGPTGVYQTKETKNGWRCSSARGVVDPGRRKHLLSDINPEARTAICKWCGPVTIASAGKGEWKCNVKKLADAARRRERIKANPEKTRQVAEYSAEYYQKTRGVSQRITWLKQYGLTIEDYNALLEKQGGVCAICSNVCSTGKRLSVDHDHDTGRVRGLLCSTCNRGIGMLRDDPELIRAALRYLTSP